MLCGTSGRHKDHLKQISNIIGLKPEATTFAAMNVLMLPKNLVRCGYLRQPKSIREEIAEITLMAADVVKRFGLAAKIALLSHSNFGTDSSPSAKNGEST